MRIFKICILSVVLLSSMSQAQGQTFRSAIVAGLNASQINGDLIAGFNKLGIQAGLRVSTDLKEKIEASVELLYSQRGSRASGKFASPFSIRINYVEMPLIIGFKDWLKDDYHKIRFEAGLSYGRLIHAEQEDATGTIDIDYYNQNDISWLAGATFFSSERLAFSARFTQSLNYLSKENLPTGFSKLRGFFLSFRALYFL